MLRVFDGHADILIDVDEKRAMGQSDIFKKYHLDKFIRGGVYDCVFAVWLKEGCSPYEVIRYFKHMAKEFNENADILHHIKTYDDLRLAEENNKIGALVTLEGLHYISNDLDMIDLFYCLGAREASLTWNEENIFATGALSNPKRGLTRLGLEAMKKIQSLGMMLDVSHLNEKSTNDVLKHMTSPILASHSNAKALCNHPRNLTTEQIKIIGRTGGFIGINSVPMVVSEAVKDASIDNLIDHIIFMVENAGIDHVGFGFDFYDYLDDEDDNTSMDYNEFIKGFENVSCVPNLLKSMTKRGFSKEEINKIASYNFKSYIKKILK